MLNFFQVYTEVQSLDIIRIEREEIEGFLPFFLCVRSSILKVRVDKTVNSYQHRNGGQAKMFIFNRAITMATMRFKVQ